MFTTDFEKDSHGGTETQTKFQVEIEQALLFVILARLHEYIVVTNGIK